MKICQLVKYIQQIMKTVKISIELQLQAQLVFYKFGLSRLKWKIKKFSSNLMKTKINKLKKNYFH